MQQRRVLVVSQQRWEKLCCRTLADHSSYFDIAHTEPRGWTHGWHFGSNKMLFSPGISSSTVSSVSHHLDLRGPLAFTQCHHSTRYVGQMNVSGAAQIHAATVFLFLSVLDFLTISVRLDTRNFRSFFLGIPMQSHARWDLNCNPSSMFWCYPGVANPEHKQILKPP